MRVFSKLEHAAIAMMVFGVSLGYYGCVRAHGALTGALEGYVGAVSNVRTVDEFQRAVDPCMKLGVMAGTHFRLAYDGFWLFLAGVGLFTIAGRLEARKNPKLTQTKRDAEPTGGSDAARPSEGEVRETE